MKISCMLIILAGQSTADSPTQMGGLAWASLEICAWVIMGGWIDKEWAREINTHTEENKNR